MWMNLYINFSTIGDPLDDVSHLRNTHFMWLPCRYKNGRIIVIPTSIYRLSHMSQRILKQTSLSLSPFPQTIADDWTN